MLVSTELKGGWLSMNTPQCRFSFLPHISELVDPTLPVMNPLSTFASKIPESPEEAEAPLKVSNIVGKVLR